MVYRRPSLNEHHSFVFISSAYKLGVAPTGVFIYLSLMKGLRYIYWQDQNFWLGYLEEYPDYLTQGESLEDLKEHLRDLYREFSNREIPSVRRVPELEVA